jgi:hypothetical protein
VFRRVGSSLEIVTKKCLEKSTLKEIFLSTRTDDGETTFGPDDPLKHSFYCWVRTLPPSTLGYKIDAASRHNLPNPHLRVLSWDPVQRVIEVPRGADITAMKFKDHKHSGFVVGLYSEWNGKFRLALQPYDPNNPDKIFQAPISEFGKQAKLYTNQMTIVVTSSCRVKMGTVVTIVDVKYLDGTLPSELGYRWRKYSFLPYGRGDLQAAAALMCIPYVFLIRYYISSKSTAIAVGLALHIILYYTLQLILHCRKALSR